MQGFLKIYILLLIILFPVCYAAAADHHIKTDDSAILSYIIEPLCICNDDNLDNPTIKKNKDNNKSLTLFSALNKNYCFFCLSPELNNSISILDFSTASPPP